MDDVLVNFDDTRRQAAIEVIADFARKRQVIFFTCHSATVEAFVEATGDSLILEMPRSNVERQTFERCAFKSFPRLSEIVEPVKVSRRLFSTRPRVPPGERIVSHLMTLAS